MVLARGGGLSGMFLRREQQLDPQARAPRIDAVLVLHFGGPQLADGAFVWTKNPPADGEASWPLALEIDRNTEAISVIRGKAIRYQEALERQRTETYWATHYGRTPTIIWVAPTERRLEAIHRVWWEAWPSGDWVLATIDTLSKGRCLLYQGDRGVMAEVRLFDAEPSYLGRALRHWPAHAGLQPMALALPMSPPAAPKAPPAPTTPPSPALPVSSPAAPKAPPAPTTPPAPTPPPPVPAVRTPDAPTARRAPSNPSLPAARTVTIHWAEPDGTRRADRAPLPKVAVHVCLINNPISLWEGQLLHAETASSPLVLPVRFTNQTLVIAFPDLGVVQPLPATADRITIAQPWPVMPSPRELTWQRRRARLRQALQQAREHTLFLMLSVLLLLVLSGMAVWALAIWVVPAAQALWSWATHTYTDAISWVSTTTAPIGGPPVAGLLLLAAIGLAAGLFAGRAQLPYLLANLRDSVGQGIQEHWEIIWRLVAMAVVLWVAGNVLWGQLTGGG